ncbi:hypothetical protein Lalb_Chr23g0269891 [Lupinus albus]|uniref:Uncharacterized protein n=1 Tax=Lupinus albus TaxID=3870 RepID=A0A6A4NEE5_LUPAL|nr:hypothetical protein Lalb_Chr23g0269891 [Lupinus albus]
MIYFKKIYLYVQTNNVTPSNVKKIFYILLTNKEELPKEDNEVDHLACFSLE